MKQSKITLPKAGPCTIIAMDVKCEILIIGWIKELFRTKEFKDLILPPIYLLKMIALWHNEQMIHWFDEINAMIFVIIKIHLNIFYPIYKHNQLLLLLIFNKLSK